MTEPPPGFTQLKFEDLNRLSISPDNRIAWDGKPVVTTVAFSVWQKIIGVVIAVAAILGGIGGAAQGLAAYSAWACQVKWWSLACGP